MLYENRIPRYMETTCYIPCYMKTKKCKRVAQAWHGSNTIWSKKFYPHCFLTRRKFWISKGDIWVIWSYIMLQNGNRAIRVPRCRRDIPFSATHYMKTTCCEYRVKRRLTVHYFFWKFLFIFGLNFQFSIYFVESSLFIIILSVIVLHNIQHECVAPLWMPPYIYFVFYVFLYLE